MELVSRVAQSGCESSSRLIVGTPEKLVTRSRSMSSNARAGSQRRVNTTVAPMRVAGCRMQLHAVTWNRGVGAIITTWPGVAAAAGVGSMSPAAIAFASAADSAVVM